MAQGFDGGLMTTYSTMQLYNQHCNSTSSTSLTNGGVQDVDFNKPRQTNGTAWHSKAPWVTDEMKIGQEKNQSSSTNNSKIVIF